MIVHSVFDLLAGLTAMGLTVAVYRWRLAEAGQKIETAGIGYGVALVAGAVVGGYGAGTLNLWLSGLPGIGRSIAGALAGAIATIEIFKRWRNIRGSTGLIFVPGFAASVIVGRWGCHLSGIEDQTYGTPTALPWGDDFGDGVVRHPVQLCESLAVMVFLSVALVLIGARNRFFMANGFYILAAYYAAQRFIWEFLKPYGALFGPFNLFHFLCLGLVIYSLAMMRGNHERSRP